MKNENKEKPMSEAGAHGESAEKTAAIADRAQKLKRGVRGVFAKVADFYQRSGKKAAAVACSVILIGGAVALNFVLFTGEAQEDSEGNGLAIDLTGLTDGSTDAVATGGAASTSDSTDDYFATVSLGRSQARDEAMEVLLEVTNDENATAEARATAESDINRMALDMEREGTIESLVIAKGFANCVAIVSGDSASVIVSGDTLTPGETAQISEIVYEAAGIIPANLKIVEHSMY